MLAGALLLAAPVQAQTVPIAAGTRVRVTMAPAPRAGSSRIIGLFGSDEPGAIIVTPEHQTESVPIRKAAISTIERSAGRESRRHHAIAGAIVGAAGGWIVGFLSTRCHEGDMLCFQQIFALIGAGIGAGGGAAIGAAVPPAERWTLVVRL